MSKKEEKAKEYSKEYEEYNWRLISEQAYEEGWDEALKNQWVMVEDKLPAIGEFVLVVTSNGKISTTKIYHPKDCRGKNIGLVTWKGSTTFVNSIIAWMPIPPFDEILKDK